MTSRFFDDPAYWRERAKELREISEHLKNPNAKQNFLSAAADYDWLALFAEESRGNAIRSARGLNEPPARHK
jgi:hypothetical protein